MGIAPVGLGLVSGPQGDAGSPDGAGSPQPVRIGGQNYEIEQGGAEESTGCWQGMIARLHRWCNSVRDFFAGVAERAEGRLRRTGSYDFSVSSAGSGDHQPQPLGGNDGEGDVDIPLSHSRRLALEAHSQ